MSEKFVRRRAFLRGVGVTGATAVAGCSQNNKDTDNTASESAKTAIFTDTTVESSSSESESTETQTKTTGSTAKTQTETTRNTASSTPTTTPSPTAVFDGGDEQAFQEALQYLSGNPGSTLEIEPGTYELGRPSYPDSIPETALFSPVDLEDVTIEGNGATIVSTRPYLGAFHFLGGSDITLRDLTIDYDPLPFTQGTITDVSPESSSFELEIHDGYPLLSHDLFDLAVVIGANLHTPEGEFISGVRQSGSAFKYPESWSKVAERTFEVTLENTGGQMNEMIEGRQLAVTPRGAVDRGPGHAVSFIHVDSAIVENVTVRTSANMAMVIRQCEDVTIREYTVAPPPDSNRLSAASADGLHVINCGSGPLIEDCYFNHIGDDVIAVNNKMSKVLEVLDEHSVRVDNISGFSVDIGDTFDVMSPTGMRKDDSVSVEDAKYRKDYKEVWAPNRPRVLRFEESVTDLIEEGDFLSNHASWNRDFVIRNNEIQDTVANGIQVTCGPGLIEGNEIDGTARHGIWFRCDTEGTFAPKRWASDVLVRNNTITRSGLNFFAGPAPEGIQAVYWPAEGFSAEGNPHQNITIRNNEISNAAHMGISIGDTRNIDIDSNTITDINQLDYSEGRYGVSLQNVVKSTITENSVTGEDEKIFQFGYTDSSQEISLAGNELRLDGESVPAEMVSWIPVELVFNRTVTPNESHRSLAIRIEEISLLNEDGEEIMVTDVGDNESAVKFGEGVYQIEETSSGTWRWVGGNSERAVFSVFKSDLDSATELQLVATAIESDISAVVSVDEQNIGEIEFSSSTPPDEYSLTL